MVQGSHSLQHRVQGTPHTLHVSSPPLLFLALKEHQYFKVAGCLPTHCSPLFLWMLPLSKSLPWDRELHICVFSLFSFPNGFLFLSPPGSFRYILLLLFPCYACSSLSILSSFCSSSAQQLLVSYSESQ